MSPTEKSLEVLRAEGYLAEKTEHWVAFPRPGHRKDLFNFADILAVKVNDALMEHDGKRFRLLVQTTSGSNMASRRAKMMADPKVALNVQICIAAGFSVEIHGLVKKKIKRGGKAFRYELKREVVMTTPGVAIK